MFKISVWELVNSHTWTTKELEFSWEVESDFFDDIEIIWELFIKIKLIKVDWAIELLIKNLEANVSHEWEEKFIEISDISRTFKERKELTDTDDIWQIDVRNSKIDLKDVIREELLLEFLEF